MPKISAASTATCGAFLLLSACAAPNKSVEADMPPVAEAAPVPGVPDVMILQASGGIEAAYPPGKKLPGDSSICLEDGEKLIILLKTETQNLSGPGCFSVVEDSGPGASARMSRFIRSRGGSRVRTGAVRGGASTPPPAPIADLGEVVVIRGSKSALERYKRTSKILTGTKICLEAGESLTVLRKKGGVLNLTGPGCNVFQQSGEVINVAGVSAGN